MRLCDGASILQSELNVPDYRVVDVPSEAGDSLGTAVKRISSLQHARRSALEVLRGTTGPVVTLGGDCASDLASIDYALGLYGSKNTAVIWCDAHADLNTPATSPSGAFSGMVLRALLGEGPDELPVEHPILPHNLILVGGRDYDDAEAALIDTLGIRLVTANELADPLALGTAVAATGATHAYVHLDLDVIDPAEFESVHSPVPFGPSVADLTASVRGIREHAASAGGSICEFAPESDDPQAAGDDLTTVLRLIGAITA
nr:arginase family protein [Lysinibacter cavernae]